MNKPTRIYIAGKITGDENYKEKFAKVEQEFKKCGYEVLSPAKLDLIMPSSSSQDDYMSMCYPMIEMCDVVFFLSDWKKSVGATMEYKYCVRHEKRCIFEKENSEIDLFG
jgi:nucleoside 2-deoxyribosyltransferase